MTTAKVMRRRKSGIRSFLEGIIQVAIASVIVVTVFCIWCLSAYDQGNYYRELSREGDLSGEIITENSKVEIIYSNASNSK
ncbi:MAG: hypothetical protein ACK5LZ_01970 [Anaerorhabdus sp.]